MTVWKQFLTSPAHFLWRHCVLSIRVHYKHASVEFCQKQLSWLLRKRVTLRHCSGGLERNLNICNIHTDCWWGTMSTFIVWIQTHRHTGWKKLCLQAIPCSQSPLKVESKKNQTELLSDWTMARVSWTKCSAVLQWVKQQTEWYRISEMWLMYDHRSLLD